MCLRRFIAHCGTPDQIISDNVTQFKLAKKTIAGIWSDILNDPDVQSYVATKGIQWKFIIQLAPWMGGFYERMVGVVKSSLKKSIGHVSLDMIQLITFLSEAKAVVNSRPLVYVGDDINSDITLSPAHFLSLNPRVGIPEVPVDDDEGDPEFHPNVRRSSVEALLKLWKKGQQHLERFWKIWRNSYLLSLRERGQSSVKEGRILSKNGPRAGDIVLIKEPLPRGSWKMGKITRLIMSQDGQIRAAEVMLPSRTTLIRPLSLLCPIECPP